MQQIMSPSPLFVVAVQVCVDIYFTAQKIISLLKKFKKRPKTSFSSSSLLQLCLFLFDECKPPPRRKNSHNKISSLLEFF